MQDQRNTMHAISESFELGNVSDQSNINIESHIYQSDMTNMSVPSLPDYTIPANGINCNFRNVGSNASSSSYVNDWGTAGINNVEHASNQVCTAEDKIGIGWNSVSNMQSVSRFDGRQVVDTNILPSESADGNLIHNQIMDDHLHLHANCDFGVIPDGSSYNFNTSKAPAGNEGHSYIEPNFCPRPSQLVVSEAEHSPFPSGSGVGCLSEISNCRTNNSIDGRRGSCKRKVEGISGQSSLDAPPHSSQWDEGNSSSTFPVRHNIGSGLSISSPAATIAASVRPFEEPVLPRPGVGVSDIAPDYRGALSISGPADGSHRSVRIRFNTTHPQESNLPHLWPPGNVGRFVPDLQPHSSHSRRLFSADDSTDTGPAGASIGTPLCQPNMFHTPSGIQRSLHSVGWYENSSVPRVGSASSSAGVGREQLSSLQEEASSRSMMMGIVNNAWLVAGAESRIANHDSANWASINRNVNGPGGSAPTAQICPNPILHPAPAIPWRPQFMQAPRRNSVAVQGSVLSSVSRPAPGHHFPPPRPVPSTSSSDTLIPPATHFQGPQYLRSALLMERQGDGILGVPFGSLQALTTEADGRNRIMSEIRNVLELVRRGENLRFEDVLILDQSAFYGAADLHDRHRDMRLDVDNMSYEELLALEERIGNVSTGLSEDTVTKCLKKSAYLICRESSAADETPRQPEDELCSICREEYEDNDELGILDCGHIHHSACIKKWLLLKNLCPICKKTALNT